MRKLWCDICGIELGTEHKVGLNCYLDETRYSEFIVNGSEPRIIEICRECENELTEIVHKTIEKLKEKRKLKE